MDTHSVKTSPPRRQARSAKDPTWPTVRGTEFRWRRRYMEVVRTGGHLGGGQAWISDVTSGVKPVAILRNGALTPAGPERLGGDDLTDLARALEPLLAKPRWSR